MKKFIKGGLLVTFLAGFFLLAIGCETKPRSIEILSCFCPNENGDCSFETENNDKNNLESDGEINGKNVKRICSDPIKQDLPSNTFSSKNRKLSLNQLIESLSGTEFDMKKLFQNSPLGEYKGDYNIDGKKIVTENNCNPKYNGKIYDVSIDLTYFDRKSATSGEINKYLVENRMNKLESFFMGNNSEGLILQPGDEIVLRFIGLLKHESVGTALNDEIHLNYNCDDTRVLYTLADNEHAEWNNMRGKITYYYSLKKGFGLENENRNDRNEYSNIDDIMGRIKNEFDDRYGKYSEGTYLLDHLVNSMPSTYNDNYVRVILSDFLFQLSPSDISKIKSLYCSNGNSYCKDDFYQFNAENVAYKYNDKNSFKTFYTNYLFQQIPLLKKLCPVGSNGEKTKVYLLGINTVSGLSTQSNLNDYYSNYLFKDCTVYYK